MGALALSLLPVVFLFAFGYAILNRTIAKWFSIPAEGVRTNLVDATVALDGEVQDRAQALANWIATLPDVRSGAADFGKLCEDRRIAELRIGAMNLCPAADSDPGAKLLQAHAPLDDGRTLMVGLRRPVDLALQEKEIERATWANIISSPPTKKTFAIYTSCPAADSRCSSCSSPPGSR